MLRNLAGNLQIGAVERPFTGRQRRTRVEEEEESETETCKSMLGLSGPDSGGVCEAETHTGRKAALQITSVESGLSAEELWISTCIHHVTLILSFLTRKNS